MTLIETRADLFIAINKEEDRDRTMPKRNRNYKACHPAMSFVSSTSKYR